jgi:hypothetical protein
VAVRRVSHGARTAVLAVGLGALAILLSACTLSSPDPTAILEGTSTGQTVGTFTLSMTSSDGAFTNQPVDFEFSIKSGRGSVTLTPTADATIVPQMTGTVRFETTPTNPTRHLSCYATTVVAPTLVCPDVSHDVPGTGTSGTTPVGPGTLTISGLKVNSTGAAGELVVTTYFPPYTRVTTMVAEYTTPMGVIAPTFHSPKSAMFVAGEPGHFWVRIHGDGVFSLEGAPSWLSILPHAGYLHGTPPATAAGRFSFTILARTNPHTKRRHGDDLTAKQTFTLKVVKPY